MLEEIILNIKLNIMEYRINYPELTNKLAGGALSSLLGAVACVGIICRPFGIPSELLAEKNPDIYGPILAYCNEKGIDNEADLYNKAMVTRSVFSKIRTMASTGYRPSKATILKLCIALNLSQTETLAMLKIIGYTLSNEIRADKVISYIMTDVPQYAQGKLTVWDFCNVLEETTGSTYLLEA